MIKYLLSSLLIFTYTSTTLFSQGLKDKFKFATVGKAKELLQTPDEFTTAWSQFDIDSRMGKKGSSKSELFEFIGSQALEWNDAEKTKINSIFEEIDQKIKEENFKIEFPEEIYFVKTTAKEESGALGYTRANYIILKAGAADLPKAKLMSLIVHELFHVLTRNNSDFRKEMYNIIGFQIIAAVGYPEQLKNYRITNPDAPLTDSYITLKIDGKDTDCMMILYSEKEYDGGFFFSYLKVGFLKLENQKIYYSNGEHKVYKMNEASNFFEKVGNNTNYNINPEEIMAMNFSFALLGKDELKDPWVVEEIKKKLQ